LQADIFQSIISDFQARSLPRLTIRELPLPFTPFHATAVVGVRRSGKTFRTYQAISEQCAAGIRPEAVCRVQFNDERLRGLSAADLSLVDRALYALHPHLLAEQLPVLFILDEIQHIDGWESFILRLLDDERHRVLVTGSTSHLLTGAIASQLRGKVLPRVMHCFSFREFLQRLGIAADTISSVGQAQLRHAFAGFLKQGGFPGLFSLDEMYHIETLQTYWATMLMRDVVETHPHDDISIDSLKYFAHSVMSRIGSPTSVQRIGQDMNALGHRFTAETLYKYLRYLNEAFILHQVSVFSESERIRSRNYKKIYAEDWGLAQAISPLGTLTHSRLFENMIFVELMRRGYDVSYARTRENQEIDFYARRASGDSCLVQVCYDLHAGNEEREVAPLASAAAYYGVKNTYVVTADQQRVIEIGDVAVQVQPAWKWLLQE